jgi:hypothetical protein
MNIMKAIRMIIDSAADSFDARIVDCIVDPPKLINRYAAPAPLILSMMICNMFTPSPELRSELQ